MPHQCRNYFLPLLVFLILPITQVFAQEFSVTHSNDTSNPCSERDCSLRAAIRAANRISGAQINLPAGEFILSIEGSNEDESATGDLDIRSNMMIVGSGTGATIDASGIDRVFHIHSPAVVTISNVTITGGNTIGMPAELAGHLKSGGGIRNEGTLILNHSTIKTNKSPTDAGGIHNAGGTLELYDVKVFDNEARRFGGIYHASSSTLMIQYSTIYGNRATNNSGGGLATDNSLGSITIEDTTIGVPDPLPTECQASLDSCRNTAKEQGGGIWLGTPTGGFRDVIINDSIISGNRAYGQNGMGGGIFIARGNSSPIILGRERISPSGVSIEIKDNQATIQGGGIYNASSLILNRGVIRGNTSSSGGGIYNTYDARVGTNSQIIESTFEGNIATNGGGAIWTGAPGTTEAPGLTIERSAIIRNQSPIFVGGGYGGGIFIYNGSTTTLISNSTIGMSLAARNGGALYQAGGVTTLDHVTVVYNQAGYIPNPDGTPPTVPATSPGAARGGGIFKAGGTLNIRSSVIALNEASSGSGNDCSGDITSLGFNFIRNVDGCNVSSGPRDQLGNASLRTMVNPFLAGLGDNGGPTQTYALSGQSPLIGADDPLSCPEFDQRGFRRGPSPCDIGAFEVICGDGIVAGSPIEICDDGNAEDDATCIADCRRVPRCGDGIVDSFLGEVCDDGNIVNDAACTADCRRVPRCGDGIRDPFANESCDDGENNGQPYRCNATCNGPTSAICGNSFIETGENCDDGNNVTDACRYGERGCVVCSAACLETAGTTSFCGDRNVDDASGETCDEGNTITEECAYGAQNCTVCGALCTNVAGLNPTFCGDGVLNGPETCDDGTNNDQPNRCNNNCSGRTTAVCGNDVLEDGETCDEGNTITEECAYGAQNCTVCGALCTNVAGLNPTFCGDGVLNGPETCDDGTNNDQPNRCNNNCSGTTAAVCGNGVVEAGEGCDDGNTNNSDACRNNCISATCGDGVVQSDVEACDTGDARSDALPDACRTNCAVARCGDGVIDTGRGEACDGGDNCQNDCTIKPPADEKPVAEEIVPGAPAGGGCTLVR